MLKPELQAKFLQHINQKKKGNEGFTLIELLVVVIIIGILAAIALPSLLGQVNKAKQAEAKQNIGAINRAQQAFYLENTSFATSVSSLGVGINTSTVNYLYSIYANTGSSDNAPLANWAVPQTGKVTLKSYVGIVGTLTSAAGTATSEVLTTAVVCESPNPGIAQPKSVTTNDCATAVGYKDLSGAK